MTTYTVISRDSGEPIDRHLTLAEAAHVILTYDGRQYEIRPDLDVDGSCFCSTLWSRQQVAGRDWAPTVATSIYDVREHREQVEAEIWQQVIDAGWARHPEAMTDEAYDRMMAELEAD